MERYNFFVTKPDKIDYQRICDENKDSDMIILSRKAEDGNHVAVLINNKFLQKFDKFYFNTNRNAITPHIGTEQLFNQWGFATVDRLEDRKLCPISGFRYARRKPDETVREYIMQYKAAINFLNEHKDKEEKICINVIPLSETTTREEYKHSFFSPLTEKETHFTPGDTLSIAKKFNYDMLDQKVADIIKDLWEINKNWRKLLNELKLAKERRDAYKS
jgi:hypothetical protein